MYGVWRYGVYCNVPQSHDGLIVRVTTGMWLMYGVGWTCTHLDLPKSIHVYRGHLECMVIINQPVIRDKLRVVGEEAGG